MCNADESEPGTFKDRILIDGDPHRLLEGMAIAGYAIGAREGYIYIRGEYTGPAECSSTPSARRKRPAIWAAASWAAGFDFHIHLHRGAGAYICGEETALIESLEGKRGEPRLRPPYPTTNGVNRPRHARQQRRDACATCRALSPTARRGIASMGTEKAPGTKLYPVSGHVKRTGCLEAPLGKFTLRQIIQGPAGGMKGSAPFKACHLGGAAGAMVGAQFGYAARLCGVHGRRRDARRGRYCRARRSTRAGGLPACGDGLSAPNRAASARLAASARNGTCKS